MNTQINISSLEVRQIKFPLHLAGLEKIDVSVLGFVARDKSVLDQDAYTTCFDRIEYKGENMNALAFLQLAEKNKVIGSDSWNWIEELVAQNSKLFSDPSYSQSITGEHSKLSKGIIHQYQEEDIHLNIFYEKITVKGCDHHHFYSINDILIGSFSTHEHLSAEAFENLSKLAIDIVDSDFQWDYLIREIEESDFYSTFSSKDHF